MKLPTFVPYERRSKKVKHKSTKLVLDYKFVKNDDGSLDLKLPRYSNPVKYLRLLIIGDISSE